MKQQHSWEITDEFWARAEPLIPPCPRDPAKKYQRGPGGGRPPVDPRTAFEGIFFVLRTGIPWNALPERFGSPSPVYCCFRLAIKKPAAGLVALGRKTSFTAY
jgi:transposase